MNPTTTTETPGETGAAFVSVAAAALALKVSARTVRRQCAAGTIPARRVGGLWQVEIESARESDKSASDRAAKSDTGLDVESDKSDKGAANNRPNRTTESDKSATDLTAHLLEEVRFLRATVEQLQRDGAEVRAALRAALKLSSSEGAPQLPASAPDAPESAPTGTVGTNSQQAATGAQKGTGAAITYDSIADMVERSMGK